MDNQIIKMLEYLGKDIQQSWVNVSWEDPYKKYTDTVNFELDAGRLTYNSFYNKDWEFDLIGPKIIEVLLPQCRQKALDKLVDIELANNNLFWCMKEGQENVGN